MPAWVILIFLIMFAIVAVAVVVGLRFVEIQQKKKVAGAIAVVKQEQAQMVGPRVLRDADPNDPWAGVAALLEKLNIFQRIAKSCEQSALGWNPAMVMVMMVLLGIVGALLGTVIPILVFTWASSLGMGLFFGALPWIYVNWKRDKRMGEIEEQFPEALDFLARSLRAGHAFSVSMEMVAQETPAPLGPEFGKVFHEHNLGAPMDAALFSFADRVPLLDIRFFVSSVMLQRETGGNLGEILTKLAYVIRERFRLKGQVKAASAHGRLTATVLILLPIFLMLALLVVAPGYLQSMAEDEDGKWMILGALVGQFLGFYFIRKIINIKV